jgi:putative restriction endonuclease
MAITWELDPGSSITRLRAGAVGRLVPELESALTLDPGLAALIGRALLDECFPESLHADICALAGIDLETLEREAAVARVSRLERRRRDPAFRARVLTAYEHQCAMCGYDGRLGSTTVALDAAHIRWHAYDGPDDIENALCLCTMHHKLLDLGALGVSVERAVTVSAQFVGRGDVATQLVTDLADRILRSPQRGFPAPELEHIEWHEREVFRPPARKAG